MHMAIRAKARTCIHYFVSLSPRWLFIVVTTITQRLPCCMMKSRLSRPPAKEESKHCWKCKEEKNLCRKGCSCPLIICLSVSMLCELTTFNSEASILPFTRQYYGNLFVGHLKEILLACLCEMSARQSKTQT